MPLESGLIAPLKGIQKSTWALRIFRKSVQVV